MNCSPPLRVDGRAGTNNGEGYLRADFVVLCNTISRRAHWRFGNNPNLRLREGHSDRSLPARSIRGFWQNYLGLTRNARHRLGGSVCRLKE